MFSGLEHEVASTRVPADVFGNPSCVSDWEGTEMTASLRPTENGAELLLLLRQPYYDNDIGRIALCVWRTGRDIRVLFNGRPWVGRDERGNPDTSRLGEDALFVDDRDGDGIADVLITAPTGFDSPKIALVGSSDGSVLAACYSRLVDSVGITLLQTRPHQFLVGGKSKGWPDNLRFGGVAYSLELIITGEKPLLQWSKKWARQDSGGKLEIKIRKG